MGTNDRRHFRRYRKGPDHSVKLNNTRCRAKLTDYSLDGFGLILEADPGIAEGDVIDVAIGEPAIRTVGKVIWRTRAPLGVRIGLKNIGQLGGLLRDYSFADIVLGMQSCRRTGILTVECGGFVKKVFFREGDMVFASSSGRKDSLAGILLREGRISSEQCDSLFRELEKTGGKEGALLVGMGFCEPKDLVGLVRRQIETSLTKEGSLYFVSKLPAFFRRGGR